MSDKCPCCGFALVATPTVEALRAEVKRLRELLTEWRHTPYFDGYYHWKKWVDDFGARVDSALSPPVADKEKP